MNYIMRGLTPAVLITFLVLIRGVVSPNIIHNNFSFLQNHNLDDIAQCKKTGRVNPGRGDDGYMMLWMSPQGVQRARNASESKD